MGTLTDMTGLGSVMNSSQICLEVLPHLLCAMVIIYMLLYYFSFSLTPVKNYLHNYVMIICRRQSVICMLRHSYRIPGESYKVLDFSNFGQSFHQ